MTEKEHQKRILQDCDFLEAKLNESSNNLQAHKLKGISEIHDKRNKLEETLNKAERATLDHLNSEAIEIRRSIVEELTSKNENADDKSKSTEIKSAVAQLRKELKFSPSKSLSITLEKQLLGEIKAMTLTGTSKKCGQNCPACEHMTEAYAYKSSATRRTFSIAKNMTCKTSNVIYLITCDNCQLQYVGQTKHTLEKQIAAYLYSVKQNRTNESPVAAHFLSTICNVNGLKVVAIDYYNDKDFEATGKRKEQQQEWIERKLTEVEKSFINKLNTLSPFGINK